MNINKGIIRNVSARAIALALSSTLVLTSLTGCGDVTISDVKYTRDENGYINAIDGAVKYSTLNNCYFAKVNNNIKEENYYTIALVDHGSLNYQWYDLFTKQKLSTDGFEVEILNHLYDYINAYGIAKDDYTEEELKELLNKFVENQEKDKQLVKE